MKTGFYFVLWIGIYALIDLLGAGWMQENSFFIALAAVWGIGYLANNLLKNQIAYQAIRSRASYFEIIYTNDYRRYLRIYRNRLLFQGATFIYMLIAVIFLFMIHENLIIIGIFALIGYGAALGAHKAYQTYAYVRNNRQIELSDATMEQYLAYKEGRDAGHTPAQMYPPATWKDKLLRGINSVFAILSMLLGLFFMLSYIPGLFLSGTALMGSAMLVAYGGLAFIYGLQDLISTIKGYDLTAVS